jgi:hypothetical protein
MRLAPSWLAVLLATSITPVGAVLRKQSKPPQQQDQSLALPVWVCRTAYIVTSINPVISVWSNVYTQVDHPITRAFRAARPGDAHAPAAAVYRTLFYFARLKPRLLFVIGSCLRALQLTTVAHLVFDPTVGVGAGLNLLAFMTCSQWPAPLVLGWAVSKPAWKLLRAEPPQGQVQVPIRVQL